MNRIRTETATFLFEGELPVASFDEFAQHRAARLSLEMTMNAATPQRAQITVSGQPDLVDAFEMALSLGPRDCIVTEVTRIGPDTPQGETS